MPGAFVDYAFTFAILLVVGMFALLVWAMTGPSAGVKVERPRGMGVVSFLFVMFALAAYFAYTEKNPFREQQAEQPGRAVRSACCPTTRRASTARPARRSSGGSRVLAGVGIVGLVVYERRRRPPPREHTAQRRSRRC